MKPDDFSFAVHLANTMKWNTEIEDFEFMMKLEPQGCFVLFHNSNRIGIATSISYEKVGWFGNFVVEEAFRREGAGSLLIKHAIDYLKDRGVETIGLYAYPYLIRFYESFGFKLDIDFLVLKGRALPRPIEGPPRKARAQDIPELLNFDKLRFGASRKKLLESIISGVDNLCYFLAESNKIIGYAAARIQNNLADVGPLICNFNRDDAALTLLQTILSCLHNHEVFICIPEKETSILNMLHGAGYKKNFRVARMFLGETIDKNFIYVPESLERG